jgi:hypothetical protein
MFPYTSEPSVPVPWQRQTDYGLAVIMSGGIDGVTEPHKLAAAREWRSRYPEGIKIAAKSWAERADRVASKLAGLR